MPAKPRFSVHRLRQLHRYLGLFIGIQFVLWTVGGLYFSWTDIDAIHGDHWLKPNAPLTAEHPLVAPSVVVDHIRATEPVDSLAGLELLNVLGAPVYRLQYVTHGADGKSVRKSQLAWARTGELRGPVGREEAVKVAQAGMAHEAPVRSVEQVTTENVGKHHEYREQPLPAWAITFEHPSSPTLYVPAEKGQVLRVRTQEWRAFDFLWMLHTMDYEGRDDFNNLLLRAVSVLGLLTIFSGFLHFLLTSRAFWSLVRPRAARSRREALPAAREPVGEASPPAVP